MRFKNVKLLLPTLAVLIFLLVAFSASAENNKISADRVAAVNGSVITHEDLNGELNQVKQRASKQGKEISDAQLDKIRSEVLESLINRELLYQESQKEGIVVESEVITNQMATIKQKFPNEGEFGKALKGMNLTENGLKSMLKQNTAIQKLIDKQVAQKIVISEKESKTFYDSHPDFFVQPEQVKASHILIKVEPEADELQKSQAKEKIKKVQQKLKSGGDFAALAKEFSEGPSSAKGGELGFFRRGQMVKPFEEAAFALKLNEVSDVVTTRFGYHLIKVTGKNPKRTIAYEEVRVELDQQLKQEKTQEEVGRYIEKLRKTGKIERFL